MTDSATPISGPRLASRQECLARVLELLPLARRRVEIAAAWLDPLLYDRDDVVESLRSLAVRERRARIRLLVLQPEGLEKRGHRLLDLAFRLSSFFEVRRPAEEDRSFSEAMLLVDETGWLRQPRADRHEGSVTGSDAGSARALRLRFEELWQRAEPLLEFRRLSL
ncbi:MAG TPA: hypothetical protein DCY89_07900 [Gammaproteobacteria bacterium]|nr:hypothetical protein [Gammaproteobacteria bacterium]